MVARLYAWVHRGMRELLPAGGGRGSLQLAPGLPLPAQFAPHVPRLPAHCVLLFQALYWSIRSEKLEWAV